MAQFNEFERRHGGGTRCAGAEPASIAKFADVLPKSLMEHWRERGWCGYASGLIWLVNPDSLADVLEDWLDPSLKYVVFGRTSFADLLLWNDKGVHYLDVLHGRLSFQTDDLDLFMETTLTADYFLNGVLDRPLHEQAVGQLGELAADECYGFEPAIALGGPGTLDTVRRVKMREHLGILAQLVEGIEEM